MPSWLGALFADEALRLCAARSKGCADPPLQEGAGRGRPPRPRVGATPETLQYVSLYVQRAAAHKSEGARPIAGLSPSLCRSRLSRVRERLSVSSSRIVSSSRATLSNGALGRITQRWVAVGRCSRQHRHRCRFATCATGNSGRTVSPFTSRRAVSVGSANTAGLRRHRQSISQQTPRWARALGQSTTRQHRPSSRPRRCSRARTVDGPSYPIASPYTCARAAAATLLSRARARHSEE